MPGWAWAAVLVAAVILLFVFVYHSGAEPLDREDTGGGNGGGHDDGD